MASKLFISAKEVAKELEVSDSYASVSYTHLGHARLRSLYEGGDSCFPTIHLLLYDENVSKVLRNYKI